MSGITALLLFAAWTLVLMLIYVNYRVMVILSGRKRADSWTRGRPTDDPSFVERAQHAHMNCIENLPVFGAIVLSAYALGRPGVADAWGGTVLGLRLAQSSVHLIGVSHWLVWVRGSLFTVQVFLFLLMIWQLTH
ncbi:MAG TPA: MAPEG family protein [Candidatus Binatia bacterium]|jgi:uncharacterized MAPEG superfamily protein